MSCVTYVVVVVAVLVIAIVLICYVMLIPAQTHHSVGEKWWKKKWEKEKSRMPLIRWLIHVFMINKPFMPCIKVFLSYQFSTKTTIRRMQRNIIGNFVKTIALFVYALTNKWTNCWLFFLRCFSTRSHCAWVTSKRHTIYSWEFSVLFSAFSEFHWMNSLWSFVSIRFHLLKYYASHYSQCVNILFFRFAANPKINKINFKPLRTSHPRAPNTNQVRHSTRKWEYEKSIFSQCKIYIILVPFACLEYQFDDGRTNGKSLFLIVVGRSAGKM